MGEEKIDTWDWDETELEFLQVLESNQYRMQQLASRGIQISGHDTVLVKIDLLAEYVLDDEALATWHLDFMVKIKEALDKAEEEVEKGEAGEDPRWDEH